MKSFCIIVIVVLLSVKTHAQRVRSFGDSIDHVIAVNKYNRIDNSKKKQGYWIMKTSKHIYQDNVAVFWDAGFFVNDKRIGVWDYKMQKDLLVERVIYLDSVEIRKIVSTYFRNGNQSTEVYYFLNKNLYDTVYAIDEKTDALVKQVNLGRYIKEGIAKEYWENGTPRSIGRYENDQKKGLWLYYNEKGELINRREE